MCLLRPHQFDFLAFGTARSRFLKLILILNSPWKMCLRQHKFDFLAFGTARSRLKKKIIIIFFCEKRRPTNQISVT